MNRTAWIAAAVLLASTAAVDARIQELVEPAPAAPRGVGEGLKLSQFPERTTTAGPRYDLYCPHTTDANPLVVVALEVGDTLEHAEPIAQSFARAGLIVVVVEPARDRASYPAAIGAVLDEVLATRPLEARESGCEQSGAIGAWGAGHGGVAVAEVARQRAAAGAPFGAVVAVFAAAARESIPDLETPLLVIEGARAAAQAGPRARALVIRDSEPCDLGGPSDPCRDRLQRDREQRSLRAHAIYSRSRDFFRAHVDRDASTREVVDAWKPELVVKPAARGDEPRHGVYPLVSFPVLLGGSNQGDDGFVYGLRPELVLARLRTSPGDPAGRGFGLGVYGEILRWSGITTFGAGVSYVQYLGRLALAPSAGLAFRTIDYERENVASLGLFAGLRSRAGTHDAFDLPYGLRVDARLGYDGSKERAVMVTAVLDLSIVIFLAGGIVTN